MKWVIIYAICEFATLMGSVRDIDRPAPWMRRKRLVMAPPNQAAGGRARHWPRDERCPDMSRQ